MYGGLPMTEPCCVWPWSSSFLARPKSVILGTHPVPVPVPVPVPDSFFPYSLPPPDLEDRHDVGVLQPRDRLRLGAEAGRLIVVGVRGQDHLQRDQAAGTDLAGLVDDAHAAAAQLRQDLVTGRAVRPPAPPIGGRVW